MISTVHNGIGSTSYEQTASEEFHHTNHHHHHQQDVRPEKPSPFRRLSLRSLPSQSKLKTEQIIPKLDLKIIVLCLVWYLTSILSNNSTKLILRQFKHPVTLTQFQFILTQFFCIITLLFLKIDQKGKITHNFPVGTFPTTFKLRNFIKPTKIILLTTLPMGAFQFIGHITSHKATSVIPVSLVHTIKLLSPITTVLIYRFMFKKEFSIKTYFTLIPLVVGVMLSCLKPNSTLINEGYEKGCFFAFLSMIIFVSQNIFAKKILTASTPSSILPHSNTVSETKFDKLTVLYWCSTIGFCLTSPIYVISELSSESISLNQLNLKIFYFLLINGFSHFIQSLMAFQILGLISTINYSIVNILKRICVILASIIYERQSVNGIQSLGLILTIVGLYSYDKWGKNRVAS